MELLDKSLHKLIEKQRFYAEIIQRLKKFVSKEIPTAGVAWKKTGIELYINPYFWESLTVEEQVGVLKHEVRHILHEHIKREKELEPGFDRTANPPKDFVERLNDMQKAKLLNIAEDYAINEFIPELPKTYKVLNADGTPMLHPDTVEGPQGPMPNPKAGTQVEGRFCFVEDLAKEMAAQGVKVERQQAFEYYYHILKEDAEKNGQTVQVMLVDDHSMHGGNGEEVDPEIRKELVKGLVKAAKEATEAAQAGSISGDLQALIDSLMHQPKDWRSDLRKFAAKCTEILTEATRMRRNRRYGIMYPGERKQPILHLVAGFDTSGSVNDELCAQVVAELKELTKAAVKLTVIQCDTQVTNVEPFNPKTRFVVHGRGGTCFAPLFKEVTKKEFIKEYGDIDGMIFFTDGENFDVEEVKKPAYPVLWGLFEGCKTCYNWGMKTEVKLRKKK